MKYSKTFPTKVGFYWVRDKENNSKVCEVFEDRGHLRVDLGCSQPTVESADLEFAGPIKEPK